MARPRAFHLHDPVVMQHVGREDRVSGITREHFIRPPDEARLVLSAKRRCICPSARQSRNCGRPARVLGSRLQLSCARRVITSRFADVADDAEVDGIASDSAGIVVDLESAWWRYGQR